MKKQKENRLALKGRVLWIYIKYQVVTKTILGLLILPLFGFFTNTLISMSGRTNISSGDFLGFFFSIYGLPVIILGALLLIVILGIDINTFIIISSLVEEKRLDMKMKDVLSAAVKSIKHFFSPIGVLLVVFVGFILPLLDIGIKMGPFKNFKIPNFITSVIFNNRLYSIAYSVALFVLFVIGIIYIFSIHFILLDNQKLMDGLRSSRKLIKKYWKKFLVEYILKLIKIFLLFVLIGFISIAFILLFDVILSSFIKNGNVVFIMIMLSILELIALFTFVFVPIAISILTKLFYKYNRAEGKIIENKLVNEASTFKDDYFYSKIRVKTKIEVMLLFIFFIIANLASATLMETYFNQIFKSKVQIEVVAHRAGGDLGAENTIQGINAAIKEKAAWTEIDVQRTKDGKYVLNHDATFARVSGDDRQPMEMTLEEIKQLKVKNEFNPDMPPQDVPTFEEVLDASKGKIGVFVELKGDSADEKMVDDVVKIIEDKGMLEECVILSLDYSIIEYTHANYPQIKTGFLYYFSVGDLQDLKGDYLIMEEREATPEKIDEIHDAGKKAIVWTVNTNDSMDQFINSNVDGIITDYVFVLNEAIKEANKRSHLEIIIDSFTK